MTEGAEAPMTSADRRARLGAHGERRAARHYESAGYRIEARNWRCSIGEIDLVARRGSELVVIEVKTRSSDRFGHPVEAVTEAKQRRLRRLGIRYRAERGAAGDRLRFDVVGILRGRIEVWEDCL